MHTKIRCIKVDAIPIERQKDLCLGSVFKNFNLDPKSRCIYFKNVTVKYTMSLVLQAFVKGKFLETLKYLPKLFDNIRKKFNRFKQTHVSGFRTITINNIHAMGYFPSTNFQWIHSDNLPSTFSFCASSHIQDHLLVPFVGALPQAAQVVTINKETGGYIKINLISGFFSIISKRVEDFTSMQQLLQYFN